MLSRLLLYISLIAKDVEVLTEIKCHGYFNQKLCYIYIVVSHVINTYTLIHKYCIMTDPKSVFSEDVRQHLSFIQGVITRMNSNSFSMKGWMVAIVSALLAVYAANGDTSCSYLYIIAALVAYCHLMDIYE